jgi:endoglucanase
MKLQHLFSLALLLPGISLAQTTTCSVGAGAYAGSVATPAIPAQTIAVPSVPYTVGTQSSSYTPPTVSSTAVPAGSVSYSTPAFTTTNCTATVTMPAPTVTLTAIPAAITAGQSSALTWSSTNATSCSGVGTGLSGTATETPATTTTFTESCAGTGGTGQASAIVTVTAVTPPPFVAAMTGSLAGSTAAITDVAGNTWNVISGVVQKNGAAFGTSSGVVLLVATSAGVWQENGSCLFWEATATGWSTGAGSTTGPAGVTLPKCPAVTPPPTGLSIAVSGTKLVNASGTVVQPRGASVSGLEGVPFSSDPWRGNAPSFSAMTAWGINIARLPLSEANWLGLCAAGAADVSTSAYQGAIQTAVSQANALGIYVILDLHWFAVPNVCPTGQSNMADSAHSVTFWTQVASMFKGNPAVLFELANEPVAPHTPPLAADWTNYNTGQLYESTDTNTSALITAIRGTGAPNVIIADGLDFACCANNFAAPSDPLKQLVIAKHEYWGTTYDSTWNAVLAAGYPVLITEFGDTGNTLTNTPDAFTWGDSNGVGYVAWGWDWSGWGGQSNYELITNAAGTVFASPYAAEVKAHYLCKVAGTAACP